MNWNLDKRKSFCANQNAFKKLWKTSEWNVHLPQVTKLTVTREGCVKFVEHFWEH